MEPAKNPECVYSAMCFSPLFTLMFSTPFILQLRPFFLVFGFVVKREKAWGVAETSNKNHADSGEEFGKYFHPSRVGRSAALIPPVVRLFTGP
jgi:hypothetical protein